MMEGPQQSLCKITLDKYTRSDMIIYISSISSNFSYLKGKLEAGVYTKKQGKWWFSSYTTDYSQAAREYRVLLENDYIIINDESDDVFEGIYPTNKFNRMKKILKMLRASDELGAEMFLNPDDADLLLKIKNEATTG